MKSLLIVSFLLAIGSQTFAQTKTARELAGLKGPVKSVLTETTEVLQTGLPYDTGPVRTVPKVMIGYDMNGRREEELIFDSSGRVSRRTTHEYLPDGTEQETTYRADGSVDRKLTFKFKRDSEGRITESSIFGSDGNLSSRSVSSYDSRGRFIGGSTYNPDGSLSNTSVMYYTDQGEFREFILYSSTGGIMQRQTRTGDFYEQTLFNHLDGSIMRRDRHRNPIQEEIDAHGNWTRQRVTKTVTTGDKSEEVIVVVKRTITYY